jgi:hypothetical protein
VQACSSERYSNVYGRLLQPPVKIEYVCTNSGTHLTKPPTSPKTRVRAQVQRDIWVHPSMNRSTYVKEFLENNIYKGIRNCWNVSAVFRWRCGHAARDTPGGGPLRAPRAHKVAHSHAGISPRSPKRPNQATEMGSNVDWIY